MRVSAAVNQVRARQVSEGRRTCAPAACGSRCQAVQGLSAHVPETSTATVNPASEPIVTAITW
jgi:hypothetical protein